ncbi:MAG: hypothetical protein U0797_00660 [Gemmataceae bacterium]
MSTKSQFDNLLVDIEPSTTTVNRAVAAHTGLRKCLADHATYSGVQAGTFLAGSYKRNTSIRPRTVDGVLSKPDIDIIVKTTYGLDDDPGAVLKELRKALGDEYELDDKPHQRSVGVLTEYVEMDVVPIIAPYGDAGPFYLPDKAAKKWQKTDPNRHTTWSTDVNKAAGERFKPLVKLTKWWRRESPNRFKRPKGFVLECIVAECMNRSEKRYPELFVSTLEAMVTRYDYTVNVLKRLPHITDPGVPGSSVASQLPLEAFQAFVAKARSHAEIGRAALADSDPERALRKWREIFGDRFPADESAKAARGLLEAPAVVAGSPYTFPDRPVRPQTPGGFA